MAQRAPFPTEPLEFGSDPRISYSRELRTYLLEDENDEEWEWLPGPSKWTKTMDEALVKQHAETYKIPGVDEDEPAFNPAQKRKQVQLEKPATNPKDVKSNAPRVNTAVFVTGLPMDVDAEEIRHAFRRYGMIAESPDDDEWRIKLYNDADGNFKGEALIIYHSPYSVQNAINLADGADFPRRDYGAPTGKISVQVATSTYKADDTGATNPSKKPKLSKGKAKKKAQEMESRLADWSDDEPSAKPQTSSRFDKVVVVKYVFTRQEMASDPDCMQDTTADMQEEAVKHGEVKNVTVFDLEEDGIVTVRFSTATAAQACVKAWNGRAYDGRYLDASIATGDEKFKRTRKPKNDDEDEKKRLEDFSNSIEVEQNGDGNGNDANGGSNT